jgi:hypothetical protein
VRPGFRQSTVDHKLLLDALPSRDCFALDADPGERDGDECREDWAAGLLNEKDRYVAANFPDSLVLRLVREGSGPCEVVASGRMGAPSVRTFAARPTDRVESGEKSSRAEVTVGAGEVWLAFRPTDADRGLSVDLGGCGPVRTVRGAPVERVSPAEWSQLLWRDRLPLPPGDVLLSVAPMLEPIRSSRVAGVPELLARLRALGYLAGGNPDSAPREAPSVRMQEKNTVPVSPGRITVRVR